MFSSQANMSQSVSQSQGRGSADIADPVEKEKRVNEMVQFLLVSDQKKIPIKKKDINRVVLKGQSRAFNAVMTEALKKLSEVYGFKVVELQDKLKDSYILVNEVECSDSQQNFIQVSEKDSAEMGLIAVILGMIFMNGNVISEADMWHALKKLGVFENETHGTFGNVRNLILKEFVCRGYLRTELNNNTDPPTNDLYWGQRSEHEITRRNMLSLVCDFNETAPEDWIHQMQQINLQEQSQLDGDDAGPSTS